MNRSKQQKQEAKQREREEAVARRKAGRDGSPEPEAGTEVTAEPPKPE